MARSLLGHDLDFVAAQAADGGAGLAVEVGDLKRIRVGDGELADAEPRQGREVNAADAAHADDGDAAVAQRLLLLRIDQAQVAGKCLFI